MEGKDEFCGGMVLVEVEENVSCGSTGRRKRSWRQHLLLCVLRINM